MIKITDLHTRVQNGQNAPNGAEILHGLNLTIQAGEVHAIMGPNGSGKSTLSKVLAGYPGYEVTKGQVLYEINGQYQDLLTLEPDVRAKEGLFLAFQYPVEIPGVSNRVFLRSAFNSICKHQGAPEMSDTQFDNFVKSKMKLVDMDEDFLDRNVNEGFSGGEKKRNEILQMAVLSPRLAILDETDSGLDIDALRVVASGVNSLRSPDRAILMITHYQRLLNLVKPDFVHILAGGKIIESGGPELAVRLEERGYEAYS